MSDKKLCLRKVADTRYPWYLTGEVLWNACYFNSFESARYYLCHWEEIRRERGQA